MKQLRKSVLVLALRRDARVGEKGEILAPRGRRKRGFFKGDIQNPSVRRDLETLSEKGQRLHGAVQSAQASRKAAKRDCGEESPQYLQAKEAHGQAMTEFARHLHGGEIELPQQHEAYFHHDADTLHVPLSKITPLRARSGGIARAEPSMALAAAGYGSKRGPVSVVPHPEKHGHFVLADGNSTYAIARKHGWDSIPAKVVGADELDAHKSVRRLNEGTFDPHSEDMYKAITRVPKGTRQGHVPKGLYATSEGHIPANHPVARNLASGGSALFTKNELTLAPDDTLRQPGASHLSPQETTLPSEEAVAHTPAAARLRADGAKHKAALDALLAHTSQTFGFHTASQWSDDADLNGREIEAGHKAGGMVLTAPLKAGKKIDYNAHGKLRHNEQDRHFNDETDSHGAPGYNKVTDVSRASIAVPHRADLPHVMDHLRQHMGRFGLELASEPKDNFSSPKHSGYSDVNLRIRHKQTGHIGELQLHTLDMLDVKDSPRHGHPIAGHKYYDQQVEANNALQANPQDAEASERKEFAIRRQRHLYGHEVLSREMERTPSLEKNPVVLKGMKQSIRETNEEVHKGGPLERPDGSFHTEKL